MIEIKSFARRKNKDTGITSGGGGFNYGSSTTVVTGSTTLDTHYFWGQPYDGTQDVNGDLTTNGKITANEISGATISGNSINAANVTSTNVSATTSTFTNVNFGTAIGTNVNTDYLVTDDIGAVTATIDSLTADTADIGNMIGTNLTFSAITTNTMNGGNVTVENLTVTKTATFFELIINKIKSAGGSILLTPSDGFKVDRVEDVSGGKKLYWRSSDGTSSIQNMWKVNDQAICQTFNEGNANKYYWSLVTQVGSTTISGDSYNYIVLSTYDYDGTMNSEVGDEIVQLGYRGNDDPTRQSAIYIAAFNSIDTGITAPVIAQYEGVNDFDLAAHRKTWFAANGNEVRGNLKITTSSGDIDVNTAILQVTNQQITAAAEQIMLDIQDLLIDGDITINGLITNVSNHINQNDLTQSDAVVIDLVNNKNITVENVTTNVSESLINGQIVYLPFYDSMYNVPTKIIHTNPTITASDFGFNSSGLTIQDQGINFTIPKYTVEGTQIRITNSYVPTLNNWINYKEIYASGDEDLLYEQILKSCVLVCADPRLLTYKNYVSNTDLVFRTPYGQQTSADNPSEPSHSGAFLYNGIRGRFLYLLPGQSVSLRSQIIDYSDGRKVLNWLVENASEFQPIETEIGINYNGNVEVDWNFKEKIGGTTWQTQYTQPNDIVLGHPAISAASLSGNGAVYPIIKVTNNTIASNGVVPYIESYDLIDYSGDFG